MAARTPTLADFRALQTQLLQLKQELCDSQEREQRLQKKLQQNFPPPPPRRVTPSSPIVPGTPTGATVASAITPGRTTSITAQREERLAASERVVGLRNCALNRLVLHCWRAAIVHSRILGMMRSALRQRAAAPSPSLHGAVDVACLRAELALCERDTHAQALRAAELCASLSQSCDENEARARVERAVGTEELYRVELAHAGARTALREEQAASEGGKAALQHVADALATAREHALRAIERGDG
jgi:hypothetical protein